MKRYITLIVAVLALHSAAVAQNEIGAKVNIRDFEYEADCVNLNLDFNFEELNIGANQSAVFAPRIFKGDKMLELPTVVVRRRGGAKSYDRAVTLDNAKSIETYNKWYGTPQQIIDLYGAQKQQSVQYSVSVPYESWMVESQLYVDCSTCGCCNSENRGMVVPDNNTLFIDVPEVDAFEFTPLVELIKPEKVAVKRRDIEYSSALIFRVNSTYIDPNLEGNRAELESIDKMMQSVISDSDYTITKVNIAGFASPEGTYASNMKLSKGRAKALETLMRRDYKMIAPELYSVEFGGENWDKLYEIVSESDIAGRDDVMRIIKDIPIDEGRESKLMALNGGSTYKYLLRNIFPATRLVVVSVDYNVDAYDIVRIGELIDTKPENLSLEEMYRLSETYEVGDSEFEKIFMTAAQIYPNDEVAQNNALVTEIRNGNISLIEDMAAKIDKDTESAELANSLGVYYMLAGDYDTAKSMLQRAIDLGSSRAVENMSQLNAKLENIRQIEQAKAFRAKIYGE